LRYVALNRIALPLIPCLSLYLPVSDNVVLNPHFMG
jgi:hypothetical protein